MFAGGKGCRRAEDGCAVVKNEELGLHGGMEGNRIENCTFMWLERKIMWMRQGMDLGYPETSGEQINMRNWHYFSCIAKMELKLHLKLPIPFEKLLVL